LSLDNSNDPLVLLLNDSVWPFLLIGELSLHARQTVDEAVLASVAAGEQVAGDICREVPGKKPLDILHALHIPVIFSQENPHWGSRLQCAEYQHRPPKITIYEKAVASLVETAHQYRIAEFTCLETMRDISLAHELYHHLERTRFVRLSRQFRRIAYRLGPFTFYNHTQALDEIAAHAFAQELLGLAVNPAVLGLLNLCSTEQGRVTLMEKAQAVRAGRVM
jgi:hypothetical protein